MMALIVAVVSILAIGLGALGLFRPAAQVAFLSVWESPTGLWTSSIIRLVFGVALWFVAPSSRTPSFIKALAVLSAAAGLLLPFVGVVRFKAILAWWLRQSTAFIRAWSALAVVFGVFILWSAKIF